jgi:hypothetical protein
MRGLPLPILRVPPPSGTADAELGNIRMRLEAILDAVTFPARRWQLAAAADHHGCDQDICEALRDLWAETYPDWAAVLRELRERPWPIDVAAGREDSPG